MNGDMKIVQSFLKQNKQFLTAASIFAREYTRHINNHRSKVYATTRALHAVKTAPETNSIDFLV